MAKSGLEVHVYGNGWEKDELAQYENIKRHGAVSYTEALDIMTNTKIVINKMPLFLDGSHERVFTAMLNGAVCCTDESGYWKQEFIDGESICFYDFQDLDNLENIIKELLLNLDKAGKIAQNGYDIAIHKHQWKNRAEQILEICNKVSRIEDINYVLPGTKNAYAFNRFLDYANDKDIEMLVQKTRMYENKLQYQKNVYHAMETYYQKNYRESMNHAIVNRITSVKHALGEYAWLYGQCEDNLSKCTLAGLLNYWISMEYRHVKDVADHRYKAYADWDILDMEEFSQAVFLGAEQADSIQAVVDYNYDLLDAIEVFAPNQMTKERICGALHSSDMEVMVCEPDILKTINLDEVFDSRVRFIALMGARYAEEIIRNMEQHIRANKPQLAIRVSVEYDNLWKLPNVLYDFREDYRLYIRYYDDGIVNDTCVLYAV
ncbi:MAG: glycosyltransferase [Clostridium sp.]